MTHELWITGQVNRFLAAPANAILNAVHHPAADPANPWSDWMVCQIIVALLILLLFAFLRTRLSVDKPGKLQHVCELMYEFVLAQGEEVVGHGQGAKRIAFFGTLFIFILFLNLIGLVPGFESPTMFTMVPFGFAFCVFLYYHAAGIKELGFGYIKQFLGPMLVAAPLFLAIEIVSHFARMLSLTVRLYANMFAGETVYVTFVSLTKLLVPVIFIALHTFVSFLQAYIFMVLAMVYVGGAVSHEH
jgi:F-type H+-transporting ATPase subunit a